MKKLTCICLLLVILLTACSSKKAENIDYSRLPLTDYAPFAYSQEQINDSFWQILNDTEQARYMAYKIWLTLGLNGNLTGDFEAIENAPMDKLIDQAIFCTAAIDRTYYSDVQENYVKDNIVSRVFAEASKDGMELGEIFYASDIEQTLISLYGDYPLEGESYTDHFRDGDLLEYRADVGLFLQHFDWGGSRMQPQILDVNESANTIICDFVLVYHGYRDGHDYYEVQYEVELDPVNFIEETADSDVLRFTFLKAPDDGRPLLHRVETLGKFAELLHNYDLPLFY